MNHTAQPRRPREIPDSYYLPLLLVILGLGSLYVQGLSDSRFLPGPTDDSVHYLTAAQSIVDGNGIRVPFSSWAAPESSATLSHYPPGFSIAIAGLMAAGGVDSGIAASWVLALSGGLILALVYVIGAWVGGITRGVLCAGLVALLPTFAHLHIAIWSEPLFLVFTFLGIALLLRWPNRLLLPSVVAALSVMVRYVGVANVAFVGLWALTQGSHRFTRRQWIRAGLSVAPGLIGFFYWKSTVDGTGEAVRSLGAHWASGNILFGLGTLPADWLVGGSPFYLSPTWQTPVGFLVLAVLGMGGWLGRPGPEQGAERKLWRAIALYASAYGAVVLFARAFLDPEIPLNHRIWAPVLFLVSMGFALALPRALERLPRKWAWVGGALVLMWATALGVRSHLETEQKQVEGLYYSHQDWRNSELVFWARTFGTRVERVYTNRAEPLFILSGLRARQIAGAGDDWEAWMRVYAEHPGPIVLLAPAKFSDPDFGELSRRLGLLTVHRGSNHMIVVPPEMTGFGEASRDAITEWMETQR